jgi:hypothetical protein
MDGESMDREDVDNEELDIDCYDRDRQRIENVREVRKEMIIDIDNEEDDR